jgi:hypothetical protein
MPHLLNAPAQLARPSMRLMPPRRLLVAAATVSAGLVGTGGYVLGNGWFTRWQPAYVVAIEAFSVTSRWLSAVASWFDEHSPGSLANRNEPARWFGAILLAWLAVARAVIAWASSRLSEIG